MTERTGSRKIFDTSLININDEIIKSNNSLFLKYQDALKLYVESTNLSRSEICKRCNVSDGGFTYFLKKYFPHLIRKGKRVKSLHQKNLKARTKRKYKKAVELYATTELTLKQICDKLQISISGLSRFINKYHRELMFKRNDIDVSVYDPYKSKLRERSTGQTIQAHLKYKDAIAACGSEKFLEYNISEIAREFKLNPTGLMNQLRVHFPEILTWREKERISMGISDNKIRGAKIETIRKYAEAIKMLRTSDLTIKEVADVCNVPFPGLKNHLVQYHRDVVKIRLNKIKDAIKNKKTGLLNGSGQKNGPTQKSIEFYRDGVEMYRTTLLPIKEIAEQTNVPESGLIYHLYRWHRNLVLERKEIKPTAENEFMDLNATNKFLKSTKIKYSPAIKDLKKKKFNSIAEAAHFYGFNPETFRDYISKHEPKLAANYGQTTLNNGKTVLARSAKKYSDAITLFQTTTEPLKSIAKRLGLVYNSLGGFVRRNCPEAIEKHDALVAQSLTIE